MREWKIRFKNGGVGVVRAADYRGAQTKARILNHSGIVDIVLHVSPSQARSQKETLKRLFAGALRGTVEPRKNPGRRKARKNKVRRNPSRHDAVERADDLLQSFSGSRASKEIRQEYEPIKVGLAVGKLTGVMYAADRGDGVHEYCHRFRPKSRPLLIADHDGKQLGIVGGRYQFTDRGIVDK